VAVVAALLPTANATAPEQVIFSSVLQ
jgi:hypothetical protein